MNKENRQSKVVNIHKVAVYTYYIVPRNLTCKYLQKVEN